MISLQNLKFNYSRKQQLIENLDLELTPGRIYGLLGKNGTGKSTLLKVMHGALFPKEGNASVSQNESRKRKPAMLQDIFYLHEEYDLPSIKVWDYVAAYSPFYPNFDKAKFKEIIKIFELEDSRSLVKYSYGQKKKFLISFGLACNTRYLLMDEPTNGLDIPSKSQFRKIVAGKIEEDQTIIISTHQIRDLSNMIDAVIIIENGKIKFNKEVFDISEKLSFSRGFSEEKGSEVIYSEMIPGGYMTVKPNLQNQATEVDLEALFNAVIIDGNAINQLFKN